MNLFEKYDENRAVTFEDAQSMWSDVSLNSPEYSKIGLYNKDDMNTGGFLWFLSFNELKFFIINVWPVILAREDLQEKIWNNWKELADLNFTTDDDSTFIIEYINTFWEGDIKIEWIGSLEELETSESNIPIEIREWFHEKGVPIEGEEKEDFHEFIKRGFA